MRNLKTILTIIVLLFSVSSGYPQSELMKDPVSFKLKNGMNVIVAENLGTPKVYVQMSFEATNFYNAAKVAAVREVFNALFNQQLNALDARLSYNERGINLVSSGASFENGLRSLFAGLNMPAFTQKALDQAKAIILGHLNTRDVYLPAEINKVSLAKISLDEVNAYYNEIKAPAQIYLTIAGNIALSGAKSLVKSMTEENMRKQDRNKAYLVSSEL
ncbi:hypothetical protein B0O44_107260 [Pedobacter nutrimenti]|uniref:Insulinase (Peptidase family M16) n=2 Tax=Pedobacter nutrimenti TaxID=1241337 RepID=A0A318UA51_9SPHI|nr:hypothetical protein B0O44_107260 [Pedobacter nutrimenti]